MESMTRRGFIALAGAASAATSCLNRVPPVDAAEDTRLQARPAPPTARIDAGTHKLGLGGDRDGLIYIPKAHDSGKPMPLAVMMHGASNKAQAMEYTFAVAEEFGVVVIAPDSRGPTCTIGRSRSAPARTPCSIAGFRTVCECSRTPSSTD